MYKMRGCGTTIEKFNFVLMLINMREIEADREEYNAKCNQMENTLKLNFRN